ncbi:MAG TPA: hypothetical protein PK358_05420 [Spirochaetota bacterium]|nr:hypothetical protein [Spirochaetota bacterium]HPJ34255.1 hypothetical protein [Spirochaetota bacterium]
MNINKYPEIKSGGKLVKKIYVAIMLWIVGRAIQAASKVDREVKEEFAALPDDFIMHLHVLPSGPGMIVGKDKNGKVKYMGWNPKGKKITLEMKVKNIEGAILMFTFQESTCIASARSRLAVSGNVPDTMAFIRILNIVETYLLPKIITGLAVKRYPKWSQMNPFRKYIGRVIIYVRTFTF